MLIDKPIKSTFCVDMATLVDRATSPTRHHDTTPTWKTLPDTPLVHSAAATLSGALLAVGGRDGETRQRTVYVFTPSTNSWVKLPSGDLPAERSGTTAVQLSNNRVMVIGGKDKEEEGHIHLLYWFCCVVKFVSSLWLFLDINDPMTN